MKHLNIPVHSWCYRKEINRELSALHWYIFMKRRKGERVWSNRINILTCVNQVQHHRNIIVFWNFRYYKACAATNHLGNIVSIFFFLISFFTWNFDRQHIHFSDILQIGNPWHRNLNKGNSTTTHNCRFLWEGIYIHVTYSITLHKTIFNVL